MARSACRESRTGAEKFDPGDWRVGVMSGQHPWQDPESGGRAYRHRPPQPRASWPMAEPVSPNSEKADKKSKGESLRQWIQTISAVPAAIVAALGLIAGSAAVITHNSGRHPQSSPTLTPSSPVFAPSSPILGSVQPDTSAPASKIPSPASAPATLKAGTELGSAERDIPNGQDFSYSIDDQNIYVFTYAGYTDELIAQPESDVGFAVIRTSSLAADTVYAECEAAQGGEAVASGSATSVQISGLASDKIVCAFTPNNQITAIRILGADPENDLNGTAPVLHVSVTTWQR